MTAKANPAETKPGNFNDKDITETPPDAANRSEGNPGAAPSPQVEHTEYPAGDRGDRSGVNQEQLEKASGKP